MKVEFSKRALSDLIKISSDSHMFGEAVAADVEARIRRVIAQIAEHPEAATRVVERQGVHVVPLVRYPYKIFYQVHSEGVRILHIRHTSRRAWSKR